MMPNAQKCGISGVKTDYINGIEYDAGMINFIQTDEGRVFPSFGNYEYNLSDHLGNVRYSFDTHIAGTASPVQQDDYYPFGYEISRSLNGVKNEYLYNKKELQEDLQTDDYGARFYDPVVGRWTTPDPLTDISQSSSPYVFCVNNPILYSDKFGLDIGKGVTLKQVEIYAEQSINKVLDIALYIDHPFGMSGLRTPRKTAYAESFDELAYNAIVVNAKKSLINGLLLNKLKNDPAFLAFRKNLIAAYKLNPLVKKYHPTIEFGGDKFFSTDGDTEVKLSVRNAGVDVTISESNSSITINYKMTDSFDLDYQAYRSTKYNVINGILKPIWVGVLNGNPRMNVEADWTETINK